MKKQILIALTAFVSCTVLGQIAPKGVTIDVHNNDDFEGMQMLDSAVAEARIIMTGENHTYVNFNSHMEMKMLRYLHQKVGLKNFIIELGEARAHYLNRYINNSDSMAEKYLKSSTSPRYMDLFKRIRKYNLDLPDSLRIKIWGIDVERFFDLPILRLSELLPQKNVPSDLRNFTDAVSGAAKYLLTSGLEDYEKARDRSKSSGFYGSYNQKFYFETTVSDIIKHWDSLNPQFKNWLGEKYTGIEQTIDWLKQYKQWKKYENTTFQYVWREENIYWNLTNLLDVNPDSKFYGQFGRCHIAYEEQNGDCSWYGYHSVVNKLKTRYFSNPKSVVSIGIFYRGSADYSYYTDYEDREKLSKEIEALADNTKTKTVTLFSLENEDAELPELLKKFSYAIVNNRFVADEEKDSVPSEIVHEKASNSDDFDGYTAISIGAAVNTASIAPLNNYLSGFGIQNGYVKKPFFSVGWQRINEHFSVGLNYGFQGTQILQNIDTGKLTYKAHLFSVQSIYYPVVKKYFQIGLGTNLGVGSEIITWEPKNVNFITVNNPRKFRNSVAIFGPMLRVQTAVNETLYLGLEAGKYFNLFSNQWRYDKTEAPYKSENEVTKGLGGFWFGIHLGLAIPYFYY